jgi:hypothetical protein
MWRAAISVVLAVTFGGCLIWGIVAVITQGYVVAAVSCMSASLVGSFAMLICHLARAPQGQGQGPVTRRIEIVARHKESDKEVRSPRARNVVVSETSVLCVAVECGARSSPSSARSSPGVMMWVFEPRAERTESAESADSPSSRARVACVATACS